MAGSKPNVNQPVFPLPTAPFVEPLTGQLTVPWLRFLVNLWNRSGGSLTPISSSIALALGSLGSLLAYLVSGNQPQLVGIVLTTSSQGAQAGALAVGPSPFGFTASEAGVLAISSGSVGLSRDGVNFYAVGATGACVSMMNGDQVQVTYYSGPPIVAWFPSS